MHGQAWSETLIYDATNLLFYRDSFLRHNPCLPTQSSHFSVGLDAQCTMRTQAHQFQRGGVWVPVDEDEVRSDVAVPVVLPVPDEGLVAVAGWQGRVWG